MRRITIILLAASLALSGQTNRKMQSRPQIGTTSATGPHQAIVNWSNPSCTNNAQCSLQVYRAQCASSTSCPAYSQGSSSWKTLDMTSNLVVTPGANGTAWQYIDKDPALEDSTTYSWVATNSYVGGTTASGASSAYNGTTNNGTPPSPTLASSGNSVN